MTSRSERESLSHQPPRIIFVGPDPQRVAGTSHAGGQLTAAAGVAAYAAQRGFLFDVVDTFADTLAKPSRRDKLRAGIARVLAVHRSLGVRSASAVVLFVGARHSFFERTLISAIARWRGVPTVFCIRDGAFTGWVQRSFVLRRIVPRLLRVPSRIVVQGARARDALVGAGVPSPRFIIVRNWTPETLEIATEARAVAHDERVRLIYVGWLIEDKGVRELMEACVALSRRYRFELELIGGGPLEAELREVAARGEFDDVRFSGWLPPAEVHRRLERSHVLVLPSYYEGFPNALLEAMACGLGSVCTDVGAIADSITDGVNGFLVPVADATALASSIECYLAEPSLVARHGAAALTSVHSLHDRDVNLARLFSCIPTSGSH